MPRTYNLDMEQAKQAGVSNRITESGRYVGTFTRAEAVVSRQKTEGVEFTFEADDGRTADFLTCWTYNADGESLYGYKVLNAIMTCMRVKQLAPRMMLFQTYQGPKPAEGFPDLMGKPIGLLLQREEYEKQDGSVGSKFNIALPFEVSTGMTAGEILSKSTTAHGVDKALAALRDKLLKPGRSSQYASSGHPANSGGVAAMDDHIPF